MARRYSGTVAASVTRAVRDRLRRRAARLGLPQHRVAADALEVGLNVLEERIDAATPPALAGDQPAAPQEIDDDRDGSYHPDAGDATPAA